MLESLKRVVRRSPLAGPARWCHRRLWPLSISERDDQYNDETRAVMARILKADSVCLDVGAHVGSVLTDMLRLAPQGRHWAFEPLPTFAAHLRAAFPRSTFARSRSVTTPAPSRSITPWPRRDGAVSYAGTSSNIS